MKQQNFLSVTDSTASAMMEMFGLARMLKKEIRAGKCRKSLTGRTLVMLFEKPSLRTRLSFETGMKQLGGEAVYLGPSEVGMGSRESVSDVAKVASSMGSMLMARVFQHGTLYELAEHSSVPVINGLSDWEHPCQALADMFTILETKKKLAGLTIAFVGDGENNVTHSLVLACVMLGMHIRVASPKGYEVKPEVLFTAHSMPSGCSGSVHLTNDPKEAVRGADVVYTDTWVSMGDEADAAVRQRVFRPYQVSGWLMSLAKPDAIFMHDLPAYRGHEVTADVIDGPQSVVFAQAENRLHCQKALLLKLSDK